MEADPKNFKFRTAHNDLRIYRHGNLIELRSHDHALQSVIDLQAPERLRLENLEFLMSVLLFIPQPKSVLVLGTAAGSLLHYLRYYLPEARITAVDIDDLLVERMLRMRILPPAGDNLEYIHADAADFIADDGRQFDLVLVDVFTGASSPAWLLQSETGEALYRICGENGAVSYNLLLASDHDFRIFYRELRRIYRDMTLCLPVPGFENRIVCAVRHPQCPAGMDVRLHRAGKLSASLGVDFVRLLSAAYNSNPSGIGLL